MADNETDKSSQTEEPTEKKRRDAIQQGNTPQSREVGTFMTLLASAVVTVSVGPAAMRDISAVLVPLIDRPEDFIATTNIQDLLALAYSLGKTIGMALLPIFATFVFCGLLGVFAQGNVVIAPDRISPKLERISILSGLSRLFGLAALVDFSFNLTKVLIVGVVTAMTIWPSFVRAESIVFMDVTRLPELLAQLARPMLLSVTAIMALIVVVDLLWRRADWRRKLRMSLQEIKDELKQVEGDPHVKAKLRDIRRQRSRKRMMEAVPQASVVIVNPTHYAIALKYERGVDAVPVCVAKGLDQIALKIREVAETNNIAIVEDPPLARALHAAVDIDQPIKPEFYRAVAQIISYIMAQSSRHGRPTVNL